MAMRGDAWYGGTDDPHRRGNTGRCEAGQCRARHGQGGAGNPIGGVGTGWASAGLARQGKAVRRNMVEQKGTGHGKQYGNPWYLSHATL
jgi:hypothetical protein